jgi:hypothetical protein
MPYKGGVRKKTDSPGITDKDFFTHISQIPLLLPQDRPAHNIALEQLLKLIHLKLTKF